MHPNSQHGNQMNPNIGGGGYPQPQQPGQPQQHPSMMQQPMNYYPQANVPMGYQNPGMMPQNAGAAQSQPSMMQQAMFGAQGAMTSGTGRPNQQQGYPAGYGGAGMGQQQQQPGSVPIGHGMMGQSQQYPQASSGHAQAAAASGPSASGQYMGQMPPYPQMGVNTGTQPNVATSHSTATSSSSTHVPSSHQINKPEPPKKALIPAPYAPDILANLDQYSVGALCMIGKEIVHELNMRSSMMCNTLKSQSERKSVPSGQDAETIMEYCLQLFDRLNELRILIETKNAAKPMKNTEMLLLLEDMTDPVDDRPEELQEKYKTFADNKNRLVSLNNDLKLLDWMATVSDPTQLKKVDKMATSLKPDYTP